MKHRRAFILLSGGLDSTTALYIAMNEAHWSGSVEGVSIDYGQRHKKEIEYAARICAGLNIRHSVLKMPDLLADSMLTDGSVNIPNVTYDQIKGMSPTYVPFRNGLMLSMLAAHAQKWTMDKDENEVLEAGIYFGAHAEDAANWAYPDCTPEFIGAMANAIFIGSYQSVRLYAPLMHMVKTDIVLLGQGLRVPFVNTWSCYAGGELHCGSCPTCHARHQAFKAAGIVDPTPYATQPKA